MSGEEREDDGSMAISNTEVFDGGRGSWWGSVCGGAGLG